MALSPPTPVAADLPPPPWSEGWSFLAVEPSRRMEATVAFARAARAVSWARDGDDAVRRIGIAGAALAGANDGRHAATDDPLLTAACAARAAFIERADIVRCLGRVLQAAERDAQRKQSATWGEVLSLGQFALVPVGRALLAAVGDESAESLRRADALFLALFVLERLCAAETAARALGRIDLPLCWLKDAGLDGDRLALPAAAEARRTLLNRALDGADRLLADGGPLVRVLAAPTTRATAAVLRCRAVRLAGRLRRHDPFAAPLPANRIGDELCHLRGRLETWRR